MERNGGRAWNEIRSLKIINRFLEFSEGSVLIEMGHTKVLCTAKLEERVPPFLKGTGKGWLTAEYSMLPGSTPERTVRENSRGGVGGKTGRAGAAFSERNGEGLVDGGVFHVARFDAGADRPGKFPGWRRWQNS